MERKDNGCFGGKSTRPRDAEAGGASRARFQGLQSSGAVNGDCRLSLEGQRCRRGKDLVLDMLAFQGLLDMHTEMCSEENNKYLGSWFLYNLEREPGSHP